MGGRALKRTLVINALYEACRDDLLPDETIINLGTLPSVPEQVTWRNSREFLANLFHYAIIRTELREANPYLGRE